jgi:hypothetical protein
VLAAVERLGDPTMLDLSPQFQELPPSALARVLEVLERDGLIARAGDPGQIYVGGVRFWSVAHRPDHPDPAVARLGEALRLESLPYASRIEGDRKTIIILIPLADLTADLLQESPALDELRRRLREAVVAVSSDIELVGEVSLHQGVPALPLELRLRPETPAPKADAG